MKWILVLLLVSVVAASGASRKKQSAATAVDITAPPAAPRNELERALTHNRRLVAGKQADLSPLMKWRVNPIGTRPMPAWRYMSGRIIEDHGGQWLMEVQFEGEPGRQKIFLRRPPERALAEFTQLQAEYHTYLANAKARGQHAEVKRADFADAHERAAEIKPARRAPATVREKVRAERQAEEKRDAVINMNEERAETSAAIHQANVAARQFSLFDPRGYEMNSTFKFIGCALRTGEIHPALKVPIYDHGTVISN